MRTTIVPYSWEFLLGPGPEEETAWMGLYQSWSRASEDQRDARCLAVLCMLRNGWSKELVGVEMDLSAAQVRNLSVRAEELLDAPRREAERQERARLARIEALRRDGRWLLPSWVGVRSLRELADEDAGERCAE